MSEGGEENVSGEVQSSGSSDPAEHLNLGSSAKSARPPAGPHRRLCFCGQVLLTAGQNVRLTPIGRYHRRFTYCDGQPQTHLDVWRDHYVKTLDRVAEDSAKPLESAIGVVFGTVSACWSNLDGAGVFDSRQASELVTILAEWIRDHPEAIGETGAQIDPKASGQAHPSITQGEG